MRSALLAAVFGLATMSAVHADQAFEGVLVGHAILPAATYVAAPDAAGPGFAVSGKFAGPGNRRVDQVGSVPGDTGAMHGRRPTGIAFPFKGQPVQGFSGIKPVVGEVGAYWVLTDNGFGNKRNSSDALLMFHKVRPDFKTGAVAVESTVFLSDPNKIAPFPIATDSSPARMLTGADFDLESIQPMADGTFWMGDEFGPYLIQIDTAGRLLRVIETKLDGKALMSPDHHGLSVPTDPTAGAAHVARRSGGYEGMALTPDGKTLWALLEQPLFAAGTNKPEGQFLRVLEFDTAKADWTGRSVKYKLEEGATAIGDFNFIDERRALIIERDNGEGDPSLACAPGQQPPACFPLPARFKRVYLVDMGAVDADGFVRKIGHIDLMNIRDPNGIARQLGDLGEGAKKQRFNFPFFTIEDVAMIDADHIIVANDNNLPFSAGRHLTRADDNEFIILRVTEFLNAR